ncbi:MAG: hypothetical protein IPM61_05005 [Chlorobi bacterium]|nr:MAG: hypothetical protein UZ07_CHB004002158 [Chlorobi bacterium OLB7]MBK8910670.1 hypothetical protein [Chlorobiota bacterium]MBX7216240.1 hypothetical protein [Candidatus Kapabacteria bacterium]
MKSFLSLALLLLAACGDRAGTATPDTTANTGTATQPNNAATPPQTPAQPLAQPATPDTANTATPAHDTTATPPLPNSQTFAAMVDGKQWSGTQVIASRVDSAIAVTAIGPDGTSLILNLGTRTSAGQLQFGTADSGQFATWINPQGASFSTKPAGSGTVRITQLGGKRVAGVFSFKATEQGGNGTVRIEKGTFDVMFGK